jgi:deoxyribodipyrimidine photo-lyase
MYTRSLFIFRQDIRLHDNTGLIEAMKNSKEVFPIFIHDTRAREDFGMADPRFGLIREALEAIDTELQKVWGRLTVYSWKPEEVIRQLIEKYSINAIYLNRSYSPRGKSRDESIMTLCDSKWVAYHSSQDFLLVEPEECEQRKVFTPFSMLWKKFLIAHPERLDTEAFDGSLTKWYTPDDRRDIGEIITVPHHPLWTLTVSYTRLRAHETM